MSVMYCFRQKSQTRLPCVGSGNGQYCLSVEGNISGTPESQQHNHCGGGLRLKGSPFSGEVTEEAEPPEMNEIYLRERWLWVLIGFLD